MRYHNITHDDLLNGEGIRVVLWVAGCSHRCDECHNKITWDENNGLIFCEKEEQEIYNELSKDYISGITFSGGDPFYSANRQFILRFCHKIKEKFPNKTIWVYTGFTYEELLKMNINLIDIDILVDGKFIKELKDNDLHWVGSSNQRIIDIKQSIKQNKIILYE